jgi:hypothetical protein
MTIRPAVVDPHAGDPSPVHLRSTAWGRPWPFNAPAVCGLLPHAYWVVSQSGVTCADWLMALHNDPSDSSR